MDTVCIKLNITSIRFVSVCKYELSYDIWTTYHHTSTSTAKPFVIIAFYNHVYCISRVLHQINQIYLKLRRICIMNQQLLPI
jgi:hypothetical protein